MPLTLQELQQILAAIEMTRRTFVDLDVEVDPKLLLDGFSELIQTFVEVHEDRKSGGLSFSS